MSSAGIGMQPDQLSSLSEGVALAIAKKILQKGSRPCSTVRRRIDNQLLGFRAQEGKSRVVYHE